MSSRTVKRDLMIDVSKLIQVISRLLDEIILSTSEMPIGSSQFHSKVIPTLSIKDYLKRIMKYSHCSTSVYVIALIYMDRFQSSLDSFTVNKFCIHKLLMTSIMVAAKYHDDVFYKNSYYARVGGISTQDMNALELVFLSSIDFGIHVEPKQFIHFVRKLKNFENDELVSLGV